jgi:hypothetical protein
VTAAAVALAACFGERDRPAPPQLDILLDAATVQSPGEVSGLARASDPDGIDSLWLHLSDVTQGVDGHLEPVVEARFRLPVPAGLPPSAILDLVVRARDGGGFTDTAATTVSVIP